MKSIKCPKCNGDLEFVVTGYFSRKYEINNGYIENEVIYGSEYEEESDSFVQCQKCGRQFDVTGYCGDFIDKDDLEER